jgi:4-hydroxy-3-methylbut-2-enyl diphosphate reductase
MKLIVDKAPEIGFCFGVRRAIDMLEQAAHEHGQLETLGAVVHNDQVLRRLNRMGVSVITSVHDAKSQVVAISSHGVSPQVEAEIKAKKVKVIDTTCPSVRRVQAAAQKLTQEGFFVVIFGDAQHPEVKGILGWTQGKGLATLDVKPFLNFPDIPHRLGILAQTTQIQEAYVEFVKEILDLSLAGDSEIRILNTLCNNTRNRQSQSLDLANRNEIMLVVGGKSSANTRRLFELCSGVTETHLIEKAEDIDPEWVIGKKQVGITRTSTPDETIEDVVKYLEGVNDKG